MAGRGITACDGQLCTPPTHPEPIYTPCKLYLSACMCPAGVLISNPCASHARMKRDVRLRGFSHSRTQRVHALNLAR
jgi:hypothetical protein